MTPIDAPEKEEAARLAERLRTPVEPHYDPITGLYDGRFLIDADWLRDQAFVAGDLR